LDRGIIVRVIPSCEGVAMLNCIWINLQLRKNKEAEKKNKKKKRFHVAMTSLSPVFSTSV